MTDPTPTERVDRALQLAASTTVHVEQHLRVPSTTEMEEVALVGRLRHGVARGLGLEGGGARLPIWLDVDRAALDVRIIDREALQGLDQAVPGVAGGLVTWDRTDERAERAMRELFRLQLASDPARWLAALDALRDAIDDNPEQAGSILAATRTWRLLELLGLPLGVFGDVVRKMALDNGLPPDDPLVAHLVSDAEPRVEDQPAVVAAVFEDDGSIAIIQIVIDIAPWLDVVRPEIAQGGTFPIVLWQTYEPADDTEATAPFPGDAVDITAALAALTTPDEEIAAMLASLSDPEGGDGVQVVAGGVRVDPDMRNDLRGQSGAMKFVLREVDPPEAVDDALASMSSALWAIRHPDEPSEPLASFMSEPVRFDGGGWFWADISDMEDEGAVIDQIVTVAAAAASRVVDDGELSAKEPA